MPEPFGSYLVYEQLGIGGMATVHRAEVQGIAGFRREVALKRLLPNVADNPEIVRSFIREARLASHLRHENVAQVYDLGKVGYWGPQTKKSVDFHFDATRTMDAAAARAPHNAMWKTMHRPKAKLPAAKVKACGGGTEQLPESVG